MSVRTFAVAASSVFALATGALAQPAPTVTPTNPAVADQVTNAQPGTQINSTYSCATLNNPNPAAISCASNKDNNSGYSSSYTNSSGASANTATAGSSTTAGPITFVNGSEHCDGKFTVSPDKIVDVFASNCRHVESTNATQITGHTWYGLPNSIDYSVTGPRRIEMSVDCDAGNNAGVHLGVYGVKGDLSAAGKENISRIVHSIGNNICRGGKPDSDAVLNLLQKLTPLDFVGDKARATLTSRASQANTGYTS